MGLYITLCLSVSPLPPLSLSPTLSVFLHSLFQSTYLCKAYWSLVELRSFQSSIYLPIVVHQDWHGVQEGASGFCLWLTQTQLMPFDHILIRFSLCLSIFYLSFSLLLPLWLTRSTEMSVIFLFMPFTKKSVYLFNMFNPTFLLILSLSIYLFYLFSFYSSNYGWQGVEEGAASFCLHFTCE